MFDLQTLVGKNLLNLYCQRVL